MKHLAALALSLLATASCTVNVRTRGAPAPEAFMAMDVRAATRDSVAIGLGTPQGKGLRRVGGTDQSLLAFNSLNGVMDLSGNMRSGKLLYAFVAFDEDGKVPFLFGWQFGGVQSDPPSSVRGKFSDLLGQLAVGSTTRADVEKAFKSPGYIGRRVDAAAGVETEVHFYTLNELDQSTGIKYVRSMLVGYDSNGVLQDLLWWSPYPSDLATPMRIDAPTTASVSHLEFVGYWPMSETTGASVGAALDIERVEAMLRQGIDTVEEVAAILGPPTNRGVRKFLGESPCKVAQWEHVAARSEGTETVMKPQAPNTPGRLPNAVVPQSVAIMDVREARLIVFFEDDGSIRELIWVRSDPQQVQN